MAREITKTNPIGVRFDKDLLEGLNLAGIVDSPQRALNLYEKSYIELVEIKTNLLKSVEPPDILEEAENEPPKKEEIASTTPVKLTMREKIALEKSQLNTKK